MKRDPESVMGDIIYKKITATALRYGMFKEDDRVVVAVSGGPDSVCLLHVLHALRKKFGIDLIVCHFDHGLRPDEDEKETRFVQALAKSLNLPFATEKAAKKLTMGGHSMEETARNLRYAFLTERMHHFSAQKIAVGHTLDDQAETLLMRLLRGSGTAGLSGIPPVRDRVIVRPLIDVAREEIVEYLSQKGMKYITDSSNLNPKPLRNDIRLNILPDLKKRQAGLVRILGKTADVLREEREWMEGEARDWLSLLGRSGLHGKITIPVPKFNQLHEAKKSHVIREAIRVSGGGLGRITSEHIEAVKRIAMGENPHARISLPGTQTCGRLYESLVFSSEKTEQPEDFFLLIPEPGVFPVNEAHCTITISEPGRTNCEPVTDSSRTTFFDADRITYPLTVRNTRKGDRFIPLGMKGHKKLKNFFIDGKIPAEVRKTIPVLLTGNEIIWVCGYRMDDRFKVTPRTEKILKAEIQHATAQRDLP